MRKGFLKMTQNILIFSMSKILGHNENGMGMGTISYVLDIAN